MVAYVIVNYEVTDQAGYDQYAPLAGPIVKAHGAEMLVSDHASQAIEGEPKPVTVVLKFASKEKALAWYNSAEYQSVRHLRTDNTVGNAVLVDGFVPPEG